METAINTNSVTSEEVSDTDVQNASQDLKACVDKLWEMNPVNDVTMSDITRAVNAFITDPGSSTHGHAFLKKEPIEDLTLEGSVYKSNSVIDKKTSSNTLGSERVLRNTYTNDRKEEDLNFLKELTFPKGEIITNILKCKSSQRMGKEVVDCKDSALLDLPTSANASNTSVNRTLQANIQENKVPVAICGDFLPKSVETLNTVTFSMLPTNSGLVSGQMRSGSNAAGSASTSKKLGSTIITTKPVLTQKYFGCPVQECNLKFFTKRKIDKHVNMHHKLDGFRCLQCGRRFSRISFLEEHENVHKGVRPYACKICGKRFYTHMILYHHTKSKHFEPENKLQCEICGVVGNRSFMSKHMRRVHLKQRYHCTECQEDFRLVRYLKDHMRMHRGEEPYKCDLCAKTFVQKNNLLQHLKRHSRELKCPKCDKVFKSKQYLKGHLLQHDGIKKFCCDICGKTFHHSHYLFAHKKSHGEKGFDCAICGGKFSRKDNLKSHIIRHQTTGRINLKKK